MKFQITESSKGLAAHWNRTYREEPQNRSTYASRLMKSSLASKIKGKTVLDVGCGNLPVENGKSIGNARFLVASGAKYTGVDISEFALSKAKRSMLRDIRLLCADARQLPFGDNSFETVVMFDILPLLGRYASCAIEEAARISKENLIFTVGHIDMLRTLPDFKKTSLRDDKFVGTVIEVPSTDLFEQIVFDENQINELLSKANFKVQIRVLSTVRYVSCVLLEKESPNSRSLSSIRKELGEGADNKFLMYVEAVKSTQRN